jgi:hypothetical protein
VRGPDDNYRANWHRLILPGSKLAYAFATLCVAVATLLHWSIWFIISPTLRSLRLFTPQCYLLPSSGERALAYMLRY